MKLRLPIYTVMHFLVDLTCIYRLYVRVLPRSGPMENWIRLVVLYNFLAFALPGLVGWIADRLNSTDTMAALGCVLAALPAFFGGSVIPAVVFQGVGNGLFHVGAGKKVLEESKGKYAPSGIFISSGAMGVFLGTVGRKTYRPWALMGLEVSLAVCGLILLLLYYRGKKKESAPASGPVPAASGSGTGFITLQVLMILLVVVLRSFYGTAVSYEWKNTVFISFLFVLCIAAGKALGGIAADWMGVRLTAVISVGGAALTVLLSENSPLMGCVSILLFNMTMPLTLSLLAACWKDFPGTAFGILMTALFAGTLPDVIRQGIRLPVRTLCLVSLLSLGGLLLGIGGNRKEDPQ